MDGSVLYAALIAFAGLILSAIMEWIPPIHKWYNALANVYQQLIIVSLAFLLGVAFAYGSCTEYFMGLLSQLGIVLNCGVPGILQVITAFVLALIGTQVGHKVVRITSKTNASGGPR